MAIISTETIDKTIGIENIDMLYLHLVPDPFKLDLENCKVPNEAKFTDKIFVTKWFDNKEEMEKHMQKASIYYAPRRQEGIGMSFLDAMAMGRCVVANKELTMSEYTIHGVNGYLYEINQPQKIELGDNRAIQNNAYEFIKNGYKKWEQEKYKIFDYLLENKHNVMVQKINKQVITLKNENSALKAEILTLQNENKIIKNKLAQVSAAKRVQNHLSYKLGRAMIENSKSIFGYFKMPFVLWRIKKDHKLTQKINEILSLPKIETLSDYKEAVKYKNHLSYKLGAAMMKATKTWYKGGFIKLIFEIQKIKKEHKK